MAPRLSGAVLDALPLAAAEWEVIRSQRDSLVGGERTLRPSQQTPAGDWRTWLILAGRGWGKTLTGAEDVKSYGLAHPGSRIAIVGRTFADARDTCVEGQTGLLSVLPRSSIRAWNRSLGELILTNETRYKLYSADEPDRLRGPQHHRAWCDELAAWTYPDAWDQLQFGLRLGDDPRTIVTTTPRPISLVRQLVEAATTHVTRGSTYENLDNLPAAYREQILGRYEGTRLGRQEILGELLADVEGAMWTRRMVEASKVRSHPALARIVVAVDPAVSSGPDSDLTGIVVAGLGEDGRGYVLWSGGVRLSPDAWARRVVGLYRHYEADRIVAEANQGGALVSAVLRTVDPTLPITLVHATKGKRTRAEPIAALWEQGRVSIVI